MNKLLTLTSALLLAGATAMPAFAQEHGHDKDRSHHDDSRDKGGHDDRGDGGRRSDGQWDNNGRDDRTDKERYGHGGHDNRRYYAPRQYRYKVRYVQPRGYRYNRWNVGARLPNGYYGSSYYVDYRPYGLAPPPRGYRWVRVDRDVYLVAVGTGLVRDIMYGLFY